MALHQGPEFSLANLGLSLVAGLISLLLKFRIPKGSLSIWVVLSALVWLSPLSGSTPSENRVVFGVAVVLLGLVFQGPVWGFFAILIISLGAGASSLAADLNRLKIADLVALDSLWTLQAGLAFSVIAFFIRVSDTRRSGMQASLSRAVADAEASRARTAAASEALQLARERLLGRTLADGELVFEGISDLSEATQAPAGPAATFDDVMKSLRKTFADFQTKGRADGRISGPVRFVFLAPAGDHDARSTIAVDLTDLNAGLVACLDLSLESLPEIGARKREGVIRLSIRYGLRVIEVAVEDNGRGLVSRNERAETELATLRERVEAWDGKLDRIARLGVGSRTSLELRILSEPARAYRATLKHPNPIVNPIGDGSRA